MFESIKAKALKDLVEIMDDKDFFSRVEQIKEALNQTRIGEDLAPIFDKIIHRKGLSDIEIFAFMYCVKSARLENSLSYLKEYCDVLLTRTEQLN